ncbi:hypothetical protein [uncultured Ferrimonas sp.]|uniref:hypothetical protein n=1 Tax=uncultured Ferrimonas sp. TaxID=432640 RepID=UPI00262BBA5C|nr:hypothetical protein [uncultured Ferrimonas sp.]
MNISNKKLIPTMIGGLFALTGCGGSSGGSSEPTEPTLPTNVTITAIDGYLSGADLYLLNDGQCSSDNAKLGTTDANGQLDVKRVDVANGYCLITTAATRDGDAPNAQLASTHMLYAPAPELLGMGEASELVISPYSDYLYAASQGSDDKQTAIDAAISELTRELDVEQADLLGDFIKADNHALHDVAQVLFDLDTTDAELSAIATLNVVKELAPKVAADLTDTEIAQLVSLFDGHRAKLDSADYDDSLIDVDDTTLLDAMPTVSADAVALKTTVDEAIVAAAELYSDESGLVLTDLALTDISATAGKLVLVRKDAAGNATILGTASVAEAAETDSATFANGIFTPNTAPMFGLAGDYRFELYAENSIDGNRYRSASVVFDVSISKAQLPNEAPVFAGMDSAIAQTLLTRLQDKAQDQFSTFNPADYGLDGSAELSLTNVDIAVDEFAQLFTDADEAQTISYAAKALTEGFEDAPEIDDFMVQFGFGYSFNAKVLYPQSGTATYDVAIFATDVLGAQSVESFEFTIHVSNDDGSLSADVTLRDGDSIDPGTDPIYGDAFNGAMVKPSFLTTLAEAAAVHLNGTEPEVDPAMSQVLAVYSYQCADNNECKQGDGKLAAYALSDNPLLQLVDEKIAAIDGAQVTETTIITLTATVDGEAIRIYTVDNNRGDVTVPDVAEYGEVIELSVSPSANGVSVTAAVK